jgi:hypothetical protein
MGSSQPHNAHNNTPSPSASSLDLEVRRDCKVKHERGTRVITTKFFLSGNMADQNSSLDIAPLKPTTALLSDSSWQMIFFDTFKALNLACCFKIARSITPSKYLG